MIKKLNRYLSAIVGEKIEIIKRHNFKEKEKFKFFPIDREYFVLYGNALSPQKAYYLKESIELFLKIYAQNEKNKKELYRLNKEIDNILESNESFLDKKENIINYFSFLSKIGISYAIVENDKILIKKGIDNFTINVTLNKLKKREEIFLKIEEGELFASKKGWHAIILKKDSAIDSLTKKIIKSRIIWLNRLYEAKKHYYIDTLTGLYTREKFLIDLPSFEDRSFIFCNIKGFKLINEHFTMKIGDKVLKEISLKFKNSFQKDLIYRIGGDRFAIVTQKDFIKNSLNCFEDGLCSKPLLIYLRK